MSDLHIDERSPFRRVVGVGGVGSGIFFALSGNQTLGRNESRLGHLLDSRDYCKLHIVMHYMAHLLGGAGSGRSFRVLPIARIGDDAAGDLLLREMMQVGIDTRFVIKTIGRPTLFSVCFQYPDGTGGNITTSNSAAAELSVDDLILPGLELSQDGKRAIALAVPEVSLNVRRSFLEMATRAGSFRAASFVSAEIAEAVKSGIFKLLDLVALNEEEAQHLTGVTYEPHGDSLFIDATLSWLKRNFPELRLIVSAGRQGAYAFFQDRCNHCPAPTVHVQSTAGAGDALLAGILSGLAAGLPLLQCKPRTTHIEVPTWHTALELGVSLASFKVQSENTIHQGACVEALLEFSQHHETRVLPTVTRFAQGPVS
jgi:sugar/nucleoside kinase (ribokinase family)